MKKQQKKIEYVSYEMNKQNMLIFKCKKIKFSSFSDADYVK